VILYWCQRCAGARRCSRLENGCPSEGGDNEEVQWLGDGLVQVGLNSLLGLDGLVNGLDGLVLAVSKGGDAQYLTNGSKVPKNIVSKIKVRRKKAYLFFHPVCHSCGSCSTSESLVLSQSCRGSCE